MNFWSAIVLITMAGVVGDAVHLTGTAWPIWGFVPIVMLGSVILKWNPNNP